MKLDKVVDFRGPVAHALVPQILSEADLLVNLSETGSLDKNVLEAAACGTPVLTSNEAFEEAMLKLDPALFFEQGNAVDLAEKILQINQWGTEKRYDLGRKLRNWVEREHNLVNLTHRIIESFK